MMGRRTQGITASPFMKQCWVTAGVSLNMMGSGMINGFSAILLPQLRLPNSHIQVDENTGSWIASIMGMTLLVGALINSKVISGLGRRAANLLSVLPLLAGWFSFTLATDVSTLLFARVLHGIAMGMSSISCSTAIAEYTSPSNRGAFLATISIAASIGVLTVHSVGSYIGWQWTALLCSVIAFLDFLIIYHSPETPSWLADRARYEDCRRVFHSLRGDSEDDELEEMIDMNIMLRSMKLNSDNTSGFMNSIRKRLQYIRVTIRKKEFYKPLIIMMHLYIVNQAAGANMVMAYAIDVVAEVVGGSANVPLLVMSLSAQRIISTICAIYIIKKVRRRILMSVTIGLNITSLALLSAYMYGKTYNLLPFDNPFIGMALLHLLILSMAMGTSTLPGIIAGEVFPMEYRGMCSTISIIFLSMLMFTSMKTLPTLFRVFGVHGTFGLYAIIVSYSLLVLYLMMPETKDRTLQDIEDEFRGRQLNLDEVKSMMSVASIKFQITDRRSSTPAVF